MWYCYWFFVNISSKTKYGLATLLDLKEMNLKNELVPFVEEKWTFLPLAYYTLPRAEKQKNFQHVVGFKGSRRLLFEFKK